MTELTQEQLAEIRVRDGKYSDEFMPEMCADRHNLLAHIDHQAARIRGLKREVREVREWARYFSDDRPCEDPGCDKVFHNHKVSECRTPAQGVVAYEYEQCTYAHDGRTGWRRNVSIEKPSPALGPIRNVRPLFYPPCPTRIAEREKPCVWTPEGEDSSSWNAGCGSSFWFDDGHEGVNFCPFCGHPAVFDHERDSA